MLHVGTSWLARQERRGPRAKAVSFELLLKTLAAGKLIAENSMQLTSSLVQGSLSVKAWMEKNRVKVVLERPKACMLARHYAKSMCCGCRMISSVCIRPSDEVNQCVGTRRQSESRSGRLVLLEAFRTSLCISSHHLPSTLLIIPQTSCKSCLQLFSHCQLRISHSSDTLYQ